MLNSPAVPIRNRGELQRQKCGSCELSRVSVVNDSIHRKSAFGFRKLIFGCNSDQIFSFQTQNSCPPYAPATFGLGLHDWFGALESKRRKNAFHENSVRVFWLGVASRCNHTSRSRYSETTTAGYHCGWNGATPHSAAHCGWNGATA